MKPETKEYLAKVGKKYRAIPSNSKEYKEATKRAKEFLEGKKES